MLKYRGGKSKEISEFKQYFPSNFDTFYEPFFGGGAVYFYLEPDKAVINDENARLMDFYNSVKSEYDVVRHQLDQLQDIYERNLAEYEALKQKNPDTRVDDKNETLYYKLREMFNHHVKSDYLDAVVYFFINKTAYSGMIRYNSAGDYNVPYGRYKSFNTKLVTEEHHKLLQGATILTGDFSIPFSMATESDFMFLDPPYDTIFNDYGNIEFQNGFDETEHRRLAADFKKLKCKALMVIGKTVLTEELYGDYIKDEYFKTYSVNIRNRFKSESKHIVVTNY